MTKVMGQRGSEDFIVENDFGAFLVQRNSVSAISNVDSLLARGYWGDLSANVVARKHAIGQVESFIDNSPMVLKLGAEMGSFSVRAMQAPIGPLFLIERIDHSGAMLNEDDAMPAVHVRLVADSWKDCLRQLDAYPWQCLYPVAVHPEFAVAVLDAVKTRLNPLDPYHQRCLQRWEQACGFEFQSLALPQ